MTSFTLKSLSAFLGLLTVAGALAFAQPVKSDAPTIGNVVGPSPFLRGVKDAPVQSDVPLLKSLTAEQRADHAKKFPRGLKGRTPPAKMQAIPKFQALIAAPSQLAYIPQVKRMWGNNQFGNCVPVASICSLAAWTTYCGQPVIATEAEAIDFSRRHGWLNGTWAVEVMDVMQREGVSVGGKVYKEGPYSAVDYNNNGTLQTASAVGPLMIAIDANALPSSAGNKDGWYVTGNTNDQNTDHEVVILGFGPAKYLYEQIGIPLPAALKPDQQGFLVFTWSTIGFVDHPWVKGTVVECFVRNPTTVGFTPQTTGPSITAFAANPATVAYGQATTLTWETTGATAVTLNGRPVAVAGSESLTPYSTMNLTLTATGAAGTTPASQTITVTVGGPPPVPFAGTLAQVVNGETIQFDPVKKVVTLPAGWTVAGGSGPSEDIGAALIGKVRVCPAVKAALIGLAFAYLMNDPAAIESATKALIFAIASCQTTAAPVSSSPGGFPSPVMAAAAAGDCGQFGMAGACSTAAGACGVQSAGPAGFSLRQPFGGYFADRFSANVTAGSCSTSATGSSCEASARSYRFAPFGGRFRR